MTQTARVRHHPWRTLRDERPDWHVRFADLPDDVNGHTDVPHRTIWIDKRLGQAARRSTLAHEAVHAARGDLECTEADEAAVEQLAARILIPLDELLDAVVWAHTVDELADECWVDVDMMRCRLEHLHPAERAAVRRAIAIRDYHEEGMP